MTNLIDGRAIAEQLHAETAHRIAVLKARGVQPGLAFVRVGEDPASRVYVGMKEKTSQRLGILSTTTVLPDTTTQAELLTLIAKLNADPACHGILVQAPLPAHIDQATIFAAVSPAKDVDGFHPVNVGKLMLGDPTGFMPCTPAGVQQILLRNNIPIDGQHIVIVGRSNIVGKPLALILMQKLPGANATVTICHSRSRNLAELTRQADIVVVAIGVAKFLKADMIRPGAVVVDVGMNRLPDGKLCGDVDYDAVAPLASAITPVPGGIGPMTITMLLANTLQSAKLSS